VFDDELTAEAVRTLEAARAAGRMVVTAESCTGGLVAGLLTAIAGSSDVVFGGYVTYANEAKVALGVPEALLEAHGAVSEEVARALAESAEARAMAAAPSRPVVSVAVTGVAGPGGGTALKPVGLVYFAVSSGDMTQAAHRSFGDIGRDAIRRESVLTAFSLLREIL